jgi:hypothetical protein
MLPASCNGTTGTATPGADRQEDWTGEIGVDSSTGDRTVVQRGQLSYGAEDAGLRREKLLLYESVVWCGFGSLAQAGFAGAVQCAELISASTVVSYVQPAVLVLISSVSKS